MAAAERLVKRNKRDYETDPADRNLIEINSSSASLVYVLSID